MYSPGTDVVPAASQAQLGPFVLSEVIGRGATGVVFRGTHEDGAPVAVKVLARPAEGASLEAFRNEVRSAAGLRHPGIIGILDFGTVPAKAGGGLVEGSPYLVMELAQGGSLRPLCGRLAWQELQLVGTELLRALAHAHAHGVIHRDLKPGNVLLGRTLAQVKLTDFGLAHALDPGSERSLEIAGTPAYMAPEQFLGSARDLGPWTDLYAFGCLFWALLCGVPPFGRESPLEARRGHLSHPVPALEPIVSVPVGVERLLRDLLEKDPHRRVRRAADAIWALQSMGGPMMAPSPPAALDRLEGPTQPITLVSRSDAGRTPAPFTTTGLSEPTLAGHLDATSLTWMDQAAAEAEESETLSGEIGAGGVSGREGMRAPVPADWRPGDSPPTDLGAVALPLFGIRAVPMIGRETERDALWSALSAVAVSGAPRVVVLSGPAGTGKSRLAEWLCVRAHELGVATPFRVAHSPGGGAKDGLAPAMLRALRASGLALDEVAARAVHATGLSAIDARRLATLALDEARGTPTPERHAIFLRALCSLSEGRPTLLWLDDVPYGLDAIQFAHSLLETSEPRPVFAVLTVGVEALADRPDVTAALDALLAREGASALEMTALPAPDRTALLSAVLELEPALHAAVEARTAGNPLFLLQVLEGWVEQGLLEPGPSGYRLKPGVGFTVPRVVQDLWRERLGPLDPQEAMALEIAAALGQDVDGEEWTRAVQSAGLQPPWALVDALLSRRLLRIVENQPPRQIWGFVHGMLREAILEGARQQGRLVACHRAAVSALAETHAPATLERLARHHLAANAPLAALRPFEEAVAARMASSDFRSADLLMAEHTQACDLAGLGPQDPRRAALWPALARVRIQQSRPEDAAAVFRAMTASPDRALALEGAFGHGYLARIQGVYDVAWTTYRALEPAIRAEGGGALLFRLLRELARVRLDRGDLDVARGYLLEALALSHTRGDLAEEAISYRDLCTVACRGGQLDEGARHARAAQVRFEQVGQRWGIADAANQLGELSRTEGDLGAAEAQYRQSIQLFLEIGSYDVLIPQLNLAMVLLARERLDDVTPLLVRCELAARRVGSRVLLALAHAMQLSVDVHRRDWVTWGQHLGTLRAEIAEAGVYDLDLAQALELAGERSAAAGARLQAREAWSLALAQASALGRASDVARLEGLLRGLGDAR